MQFLVKARIDMQVICWLLVPGFWFLAAGFWQLVSGYWSLVTGLWLLATGLWLLASVCHYQLSIIHYLPCGAEGSTFTLLSSVNYISFRSLRDRQLYELSTFLSLSIAYPAMWCDVVPVEPSLLFPTTPTSWVQGKGGESNQAKL